MLYSQGHVQNVRAQTKHHDTTLARHYIHPQLKSQQCNVSSDKEHDTMAATQVRQQNGDIHPAFLKSAQREQQPRENSRDHTKRMDSFIHPALLHS